MNQRFTKVYDEMLLYIPKQSAANNMVNVTVKTVAGNECDELVIVFISV